MIIILLIVKLLVMFFKIMMKFFVILLCLYPKRKLRLRKLRASGRKEERLLSGKFKLFRKKVKNKNQKRKILGFEMIKSNQLFNSLKINLKQQKNPKNSNPNINQDPFPPKNQLKHHHKANNPQKVIQQ